MPVEHADIEVNISQLDDAGCGTLNTHIRVAYDQANAIFSVSLIHPSPTLPRSAVRRRKGNYI